jgi:hypothetical protein
MKPSAFVILRILVDLGHGDPQKVAEIFAKEFPGSDMDHDETVACFEILRELEMIEGDDSKPTGFGVYFVKAMRAKTSQ